MFARSVFSKDLSVYGLLVLAVSCWFSADSAGEPSCNAPPGVINAPSETCIEGGIIQHSGYCHPICNSGFQPSHTTLSCVMGVLSPPTFTCAGLACTFVGRAAIPNALDPPCQEGTHVTHGTNCTPQCQNGYARSETSLSCYAGALTPSTFTCTGLPCDVPNVSNTGETPCLEGFVIEHGSRCTPNCLPGYVAMWLPLPGYVFSLLCTATVLSPGFFCAEAPCYAPVVTNAAVHSCAEGGLVQHGDNCTSQCSTGYTAVSSEFELYPSDFNPILRCRYGKLYPPTFDCMPSSCSAPSGIPNSGAPSCKEGETLDHGSVCTVQCASGYSPTPGTEILNCSLGELDPSTFTCVPSPCKAPAGIAYATSPSCAEGSIMDHGEQCTASCIFGYVPTVPVFNCSFGNLSALLAVSATGSTTATTFRCLGAPCPSPTGIAYSRSPTCGVGEEVPHLGICIPQCKSGFLPSVQNLSCAYYILSPPTYQCFEGPCAAPGTGQADECQAERVSQAITINSGVTWHFAMASLGGSRAVVCFQDNQEGQVGRCGVVTANNLELLPASTLQVHSGVTSDYQLAALSSSKVLICYRLHHSDYRTESLCDMLDVSGLDSSSPMLTHLAGGRHNIGAAVWRYTAAPLANDRALVCYQEQSSSKCIVIRVPAQVSSEIVLSNGSSSSLTAAALGTDRALVCFSEVQRDESGICSVLSFDQTQNVPSKGPEHIVVPESIAYPTLAQLTSDKAIMCYSDWSQLEYGRCHLINASGAELSWTNATNIEHHIYRDHRLLPGTTRYISLAAVGSTRAVACFQLAISAQERYGYCKVLESMDTGLIQGADLVLNPATTWNVASANLDQGRVVVCFSDTSRSERGSCNVLKPGSGQANWRDAVSL